MWLPYEIPRKHPQDFNVKYRLYTKEEGGRKLLPWQGYRCDFAYDGDDIKKVGIYAIHPEFEDKENNVILESDQEVFISGTARMWILFDEMRELVHKQRIKVGTKGYFMEGSKRVGELEVTKIVGLFTN